MPMERGGIETKVVPQRLQGLAAGQQESHGTDIAVVGAPLEQRSTIAVLGCRGIAFSHIIEHQVSATILNPINHVDSFLLLPSAREDELHPLRWLQRHHLPSLPRLARDPTPRDQV